MPDPFVSLAFALGGLREPAPLAAFVPPAASPSVSLGLANAPGGAPTASPFEPEPPVPPLSGAAVARELTLLRLAACEAYARASDRLIEALGREVLGRELVMGGCDLEALVRATLARLRDAEPIAIRVPRGAAASFALDVPVIEDPELAAGDFVVDVRDGAIDARFALRFDGLLESLR